MYMVITTDYDILYTGQNHLKSEPIFIFTKDFGAISQKPTCMKMIKKKVILKKYDFNFIEKQYLRNSYSSLKRTKVFFAPST